MKTEQLRKDDNFQELLSRPVVSVSFEAEQGDFLLSPSLSIAEQTGTNERADKEQEVGQISKS